MKVSIVLPTKDEQNSIEKVVRDCLSLGFEKEIIVVDDSADRTPEIAEKLGCKVIRGVKGYGRAFLEGFRHSSGDIIVMLDADGSYDALEIPRLIEPIVKGEADLVIGSRFKGKIMPKAMPWHHRYVGNPVLTKLTNLLFKTKLSDVHSGMRALRKDALAKIDPVCPGMEFATELVLKAAIKGLRIVEVPITYHPRIGFSKLRSFRDGWRHLRLVLAASPIYLFLLPSIILILLGIATALFVIVLQPIRTHTLIFGSTLLLLGIQTFFFGVSGKIYLRQIGFGVRDWLTEAFGKYSTMEKLLFFGLALLILGTYSGYRVFASWVERGFGSLAEFNQALVSLILIVSGFQIAISSIFLSMFLLKEEKDNNK